MSLTIAPTAQAAAAQIGNTGVAHWISHGRARIDPATKVRATSQASIAVRGEVVELDAAGRVIARHAHDGLGWEVDPKSLEGDPGELATRPRHEAS